MINRIAILAAVMAGMVIACQNKFAKLLAAVDHPNRIRINNDRRAFLYKLPGLRQINFLNPAPPRIRPAAHAHNTAPGRTQIVRTQARAINRMRGSNIEDWLTLLAAPSGAAWSWQVSDGHGCLLQILTGSSACLPALLAGSASAVRALSSSCTAKKIIDRLLLPAAYTIFHLSFHNRPCFRSVHVSP